MRKVRDATADSLSKEGPISLFDRLIKWLLIALLVFMPLAFGARSAWSEEVVILLSGAIVICFLMKLVSGRSQGIIWSWAYVPACVFLLVAALQLISLPAGLLSFISPNTVALKTELLGDLPNSEKLLKTMTLSFYPYATRHDFRLVLSVVGVFVVVFNVFRRPEQIKRLLMSIALIAGLVALIALVQGLLGNGKIYWVIPNPHSKALAGPFVNHSHYGQFMNLSIGAALGWLLVKLHEDFNHKTVTTGVVLDYLSSPSARWIWIFAAITVLGAATVFASLSRGGMISLLVATFFTAVLLCRKRSLHGRGWIMAVMILGAFICILLIGFNAIYDRFATLAILDNYEHRWQILKDLTALYRRFPVFGTGLGTHSVVYPMFQYINTTLLFTHAENEYAQVVEETGFIGLIALIIFGVIIWSKYAKSIGHGVKASSNKLIITLEGKNNSPEFAGYRHNLPVSSAAYGLGFGLLAILVHSLSDFGQHVPANSFLTAIFCALLLVLAQQKTQKSVNVKTAKYLLNSKLLGSIAFFGVCGIWIWSLNGANNARLAEKHWKKTLSLEKVLVNKNWRGSKAQYSDLIYHASAASRCEPENIHYRYSLNIYRWYSISNSTDDQTQEIIIPEESMPLVQAVVTDLDKTRTFCPTYGPIYSVAGQLEKFIFNNSAGEEKIRKGYSLAHCDPIACFVAARLDIAEGNIDAGIEKYKNAVELNHKLFREVVYISINDLSRPNMAIEIAGDNISWLKYVAGFLESMQYTDLVEKVHKRIKVLLEEKCLQPNAPASTFASLGQIYAKDKNIDLAIENYRRALALDYSQTKWRLELAKLLAENEKIPEAMQEARICLRVQPQFKAAKELLANLSIRNGRLNEEIALP